MTPDRQFIASTTRRQFVEPEIELRDAEARQQHHVDGERLPMSAPSASSLL